MASNEFTSLISRCGIPVYDTSVVAAYVMASVYQGISKEVFHRDAKDVCSEKILEQNPELRSSDDYDTKEHYLRELENKILEVFKEQIGECPGVNLLYGVITERFEQRGIAAAEKFKVVNDNAEELLEHWLKLKILDELTEYFAPLCKEFKISGINQMFFDLNATSDFDKAVFAVFMADITAKSVIASEEFLAGIKESIEKILYDGLDENIVSSVKMSYENMDRTVFVCAAIRHTGKGARFVINKLRNTINCEVVERLNLDVDLRYISVLEDLQKV